MERRLFPCTRVLLWRWTFPLHYRA